MTVNLSQFQRLKRVAVPALDDILGIPYPVLDDGFIRVIDYWGTDESVVQAARISYGAGTKQVSDDRGLIRYMLRKRHTSPFEMCAIKFHIRVPMDVWRQWVRHRTASISEYSTRYSEAIDATHQTSVDQWRSQSSTNKQGSGEFLDKSIGQDLTHSEYEFQVLARAVYQTRLSVGVAREQARKDLPLSTYTEAYWEMDLHNLLHFLSLRMDEHAQHEIRQYANIIGNEIVSKWCPLTWEAFLDYRLNSLTFSHLETTALSALLSRGEDHRVLVQNVFRQNGWLRDDQGLKVKNREVQEFISKLTTLGIAFPYDLFEPILAG